METKELISVIVPVYNAAPYLKTCLDSICRQTYENLEVILVDDGSSDGGGEICDAYERKDCRLRVIHQENRGVLAARNKGVVAAKGNYISFVDSDDWITPELYTCLYHEAKLQGADLVDSARYIFDETAGSCFAESERRSEHCEEYHKIGQAAGVVTEEVSWSLCGKLFERELMLENYGKVDRRLTYYEDAALVILCVIQARKCVLLDKPMYYYRQRGRSLCHSIVPNWLEQVNIFYSNMEQHVAGYSDKWMERVRYCVADAAVRGVNGMMGLGLKAAIPLYIPPFPELEEASGIVLYGAGKIGRSYHRMFQLVRPYQLVLWVDKQHEKLKKEGLAVEGIEALLKTEFDRLLIAVERRNSAQQIQKELEGYGIAPEKILWRPPRNLLSAGT
jgi:glycosyltransferase involved in cell wall biosynthesis